MASLPPVLRTPDERFAGLIGFPFDPHYLTVDGGPLGPLRLHYLDEGPRDAPVVLMLHGEPTWSYLYRKMIPAIVAAGFRAVAPDLIGFGRSDKPTQRADYTYDAHVGWLRAALLALDLKRITLVCQDWGGPIGLRTVSDLPERFDAILAANTLLPNCEPPPAGIEDWPGAGIQAWVDLANSVDDLPVGEIVAGVCVTRPGAAVLTAYDAPFPDASFKAGVLAFPGIIPIAATMAGVAENRRAWEFFERFEKPFDTAFSDSDPATKPWAEVFQRRVPGAAGQRHGTIAKAGHFLQEEQGEALAGEVIELLRRTYG